MLTDRITLSPSAAALEPEDYLSSSLGVIFPDDITNQHGDPSTPVIYTSPQFGKIFLSLADPVGEGSRQLFAQYLWNAGVYVAVGLEDASLASEDRGDDSDDDDYDDYDDDAEPGRGMGGQNRRTVLSTRGLGSGNGKVREASAGLEKDAWDVRGETVLELGAGTGIAGIVAVKAGAREVITTDYPAEEVLLNLRGNVERNLEASERERCSVKGHEWGMVPGPGPGDSGELHGLDETVTGSVKERSEGGAREGVTLKSQEANTAMNEDKSTEAETIHDVLASHAQHFTRIILADCLWMPSQHANLHRSIAHFLSPDGYAIVVAGFHTGRAKMAPFFSAEALGAVGLEVKCIAERDAIGRRREWRSRELGDGGEGREDLSERKRWLVVAVLRRMLTKGEEGG